MSHYVPHPLKRPKSGLGRERESAGGQRSNLLPENSKWRRIDEKANGPRGEMESADNKDGGEIYVFRLRCDQCCKHFTLGQNFCWSVLKSAFSDFGISQNTLLIKNKSQTYDPFDPLHSHQLCSCFRRINLTIFVIPDPPSDCHIVCRPVRPLNPPSSFHPYLMPNGRDISAKVSDSTMNFEFALPACRVCRSPKNTE